jgi:ketosteroid isomerase-like protein
MTAKHNLELVEQLQQATRDQDYDRLGDLLADDAVFRMAGVPQALGGVPPAGRRSSTSSAATPAATSRSSSCSVTTGMSAWSPR